MVFHGTDKDITTKDAAVVSRGLRTYYTTKRNLCAGHSSTRALQEAPYTAPNTSNTNTEYMFYTCLIPVRLPTAP